MRFRLNLLTGLRRTQSQPRPALPLWVLVCMLLSPGTAISHSGLKASAPSEPQLAAVRGAVEQNHQQQTLRDQFDEWVGAGLADATSLALELTANRTFWPKRIHLVAQQPMGVRHIPRGPPPMNSGGN